MQDTVTVKRSPMAWVPRFIRHDFLRKMIALFFALLVYFMVTSKIGTEEKVSNVPVNITLPAKLVNLSDQTPRVTLIVRGNKRMLSKLTASDIKINTNVIESKFQAGAPYTLKLTSDNVNLPFGVRVSDIQPAEIILNLEPVESRLVKVKPAFDSIKKMPEDYVVGRVTLTPEEVWITGPESMVKNIASVQTEPIPLDHQTESFDFQATIGPKNGFKVSPDRVNVNVEIVKYFEDFTMKSIPIRILETTSEGLKMKVELLSTPHVEVTLNGPSGKISAMKPEMIKAYIDISAFDQPGQYSVAVGCWLDINGVKVKNIYPKQITVKLSRK